MKIFWIFNLASVIAHVRCDEQFNKNELSETAQSEGDFATPEPLPTPGRLSFLRPTFIWKPKNHVETIRRNDEIVVRNDHPPYGTPRSSNDRRNFFSQRRRPNIPRRPLYDAPPKRRMDSDVDLYYDDAVPSRPFMEEASQNYEVNVAPDAGYFSDENSQSFRGVSDGSLNNALNYLWSHRKNKYDTLFKSLDLATHVEEKEGFFEEDDFDTNFEEFVDPYSKFNTKPQFSEYEQHYFLKKPKKRKIPYQPLSWLRRRSQRLPNHRRWQPRANRRQRRGEFSSRMGRFLPHFQMIRETSNGVYTPTRDENKSYILDVSIIDNEDTLLDNSVTLPMDYVYGSTYDDIGPLIDYGYDYSAIDYPMDIRITQPLSKRNQNTEQDSEYVVEIVELSDDNIQVQDTPIERMDNYNQPIERPIFKGNIRKNIRNTLDRLKGTLATRIRPQMVQTTKNFMDFLGQKFNKLPRLPHRIPLGGGGFKPVSNVGFKPMTSGEIYGMHQGSHKGGSSSGGHHNTFPAKGTHQGGHHSHFGSGGQSHGHNQVSYNNRPGHGHVGHHNAVSIGETYGNNQVGYNTDSGTLKEDFKKQLSGQLRRVKNSMNKMMNTMTHRLPTLGKSITVMSFLAFSVFIANLGVNALANTTFLVNSGRSSPEFGAFEPLRFDLDGMITDLDALLLEEEPEVPESEELSISNPWTIASIAKIAEAVYDDLHRIASLGMQGFGDTLGGLLSEDSKDQGEYSAIDDFYKSELISLNSDCYHLLLCETYRMLASNSPGSEIYKLLPFWTFGISWIDEESSDTVMLLENLRASIAGQTGRNCPYLFQCSETRKVRKLLDNSKKEILEEFSGSDDTGSHFSDIPGPSDGRNTEKYPKSFIFDVSVPVGSNTGSVVSSLKTGSPRIGSVSKYKGSISKLS